MILLTGASGTFGSHVAEALTQQRVLFRATAQNSQRIKEKLGDQVEVVSFDWNRSDSFSQVLTDITVLYLISPPFTSDFDVKAAPFVDEAKRQGVKHIVLTTGLFAENRPDNLFHKTEELVKQSGINYTLIRPNFLFQNFVNYDLQPVQNGTIYLPSGHGKAAYVDVRDVAALTAKVLINPDQHLGKAYAVTGDTALSHADMADIFSAVLGRPVQHIDPSVEEYKQTLSQYGVPDGASEFLGMLYTTLKEGQWAKATDDVQKVTGKPARTFVQFVEENKTLFSQQ